MKRRYLALLVATVLAGLVFVPVAVAGPPVDVSGTWDYPEAVINLDKIAGGNVFISGTERGFWAGTFEGVSEEAFRAVIHRNGYVWATFTLVFQGTVAGVQGTMVMELVGLATVDKDGAFRRLEGHWVIKSGTAGLAGLTGEGSWGAWGGALTEYAGKIHW